MLSLQILVPRTPKSHCSPFPSYTILKKTSGPQLTVSRGNSMPLFKPSSRKRTSIPTLSLSLPETLTPHIPNRMYYLSKSRRVEQLLEWNIETKLCFIPCLCPSGTRQRYLVVFFTILKVRKSFECLLPETRSGDLQLPEIRWHRI